MSRNNVSATATASAGTGFFGLLTLAFIILKLCNVIRWSWVWVLSPLWVPVVLFILIVILFVWICK